MLFENLKIRDVKLKNRVVVSPMCQYSAKEGYVQTHHKTHYGQLAMGGAGLVFLEATGVTAQGRIGLSWKFLAITPEPERQKPRLNC